MYEFPTILALSFPSLLGGFGSVLDLGGAFLPTPTLRNGWARDAAALRADWRATGRDLGCAMQAQEKALSK